MRPIAKCACAALAAVLLPRAAPAQFNNEWATFANESTARLHNPDGSVATLVNGNPDEKHFAFGDLDLDGWTDLVMVTKFPTSEPGMRRGFLLMNEGGVLVDRTAQYASDSDHPSSQGLLDLGQLAQGADRRRERRLAAGRRDRGDELWNVGVVESQYISHPRIYINKGFDTSGNWLGLRYEEARIPNLVGANGLLAAPRGCSIAVGDVTATEHPSCT
jgi:hypothetical protein